MTWKDYVLLFVGALLGGVVTFLYEMVRDRARERRHQEHWAPVRRTWLNSSVRNYIGLCCYGGSYQSPTFLDPIRYLPCLVSSLIISSNC